MPNEISVQVKILKNLLPFRFYKNLWLRIFNSTYSKERHVAFNHNNTHVLFCRLRCVRCLG